MFSKHGGELDVVALIKISVIAFVFGFDICFGFCCSRPSLARLARFRLACTDLRLFAFAGKSGMHRKRHRIVVLLQAPNALANHRTFEDTGHGNHVVGLHQIQTDRDRTAENRIGFGKLKLLACDIANQ